MTKKKKRVVAIADLHCGHRVGLTPPAWQLNPDNEADAKWLTLQQAQWDWYCKTMRKLRPIHLLLVLGECVDGASAKAESRDSIRIKRPEQVDMATKAILEAKAAHIEMVYGTRYHVRDWEDDVCAGLANAKIGAHGWPEVYGVVFDIKHKVGASTIPHGRMTALLRAQLWNALWAEAKRQPRADILLRGHVHYCMDGAVMVGDKEVRCITCPALQGVGTEFGAEQCEGLIDFGLLQFDVYEDGTYSWQKHVVVLESQRAQTSKY